MTYLMHLMQFAKNTKIPTLSNFFVGGFFSFRCALVFVALLTLSYPLHPFSGVSPAPATAARSA